MDGSNKPNDPKRKASLPLTFAGIFILAIPFLKLIEAGLRLSFMKEHYGSVREALTQDLWFSDGWWSYVATPLGLVMTLAPFALLIGAFLCCVTAIRIKK